MADDSAEKVNDELTEASLDELWDKGADEDLDTIDDPAPDPDPDPALSPSPPPDPAPAEPAPVEDDNEKLRHRLKSAEGRLKVFEGQVADMRGQLEQASQPEEPPPEPEPEIPEGWSKEDWDDYQSDNPVSAELHTQQSREVRQLRETLDQTVNQQNTERLQREFNSTVQATHPDYLELLSNERTDIRTFIESEKNPLLREKYESVYRSGTAEEVVSLVSSYKASKPTGDDLKQEQRRQEDDAIAVPSSSPLPSGDRAGMPDKDDVDAAWDHFTDDSLD